MNSLRNAVRRSFLVCATISILGLVYLLGAGPAVWLVNKTGSGEEILDSIYAPVTWFHKHTALQKPIDIYIDFFDGD